MTAPRAAQRRLPRPAVAAVLGGIAVCAAAVSWLFVVHLGAAPSQRLVDLDVYRNAGRSVLEGRVRLADLVEGLMGRRPTGE